MVEYFYGKIYSSCYEDEMSVVNDNVNHNIKQYLIISNMKEKNTAEYKITLDNVMIENTS